ncbi:mitochondrial import inner membrane translocase subunit Tim23-like [Cimex lectularius]|uniref:Mitochondrial import inner membrane translocase subunit TIM23 n=1 Tax=Cimex lectularius TaxID=79782 RepID=A0A8I6TEN1_CIMLE|nr:mitochondrial import inner membrane translocase subunit Tim23-like [Cimex lectularius]
MDTNNYPPAELIKSPYLDMGFVPDSNKYIYLEGDRPVRGRMEHCFFEIGTAVFIGGAIGGLRGLLQGNELARGYPPKLYRVVLFNQIVKSSTLGNTMGVLALLFSGSGIIISELRKKEDPFNNIAAATMTGILFQSYGGRRKMTIGGVAGFFIGSLLTLWTQRRVITSYLSRKIPTSISVHTSIDKEEN